MKPASRDMGGDEFGSLKDVLDFWLDEFAECQGQPNAAQVAGCIATFTGYPGVDDPVAFTQWLIEESMETEAEKLDDANAAGERAKREKRSAGKREVERRSFTLDNVTVERRTDAKGDPVVSMRGHAAVFNSFSEDLGGFRENIQAGAFTKTLGEADVRALFNHDPNLVLGRNTAGTLRLGEDEHGLAVEIDADPRISYVNDLAIAMERGDINQMSFAFQTMRDDWRTVNGSTERTLLEVRLLDVSPVTYPAYPATDISMVRSALATAGIDLDVLASANAEKLAEIRSLLGTVQAAPELVKSHHSAESNATTETPAQGSRATVLRRRLALADRAV